uniref:Uncharacterized protein n=1 Tax=Babesia bovis TaxID=5865 RepID=S6B3E6_BABBO|nr:hypothetical protein [Babesia bovis]
MDSSVLQEASELPEEQPQDQGPNEVPDDQMASDQIDGSDATATHQGQPVDENYGEAEQLAEVILVTTSLGGMKRQFFQSKLAQHILDCKGIVYYLIDANRDFTRAAALKDHLLFEQWNSEGLLKKETVNGRESIVLPQLIIDGISIGSTKDIQDLEDDGDLDYILARMTCPQCFAEKGQDAVQCPQCKTQYRMKINPEYVDGVDVQRICQGVLVG